MYSRKQALALARQFRTCPPVDVRGNNLKGTRDKNIREGQIRILNKDLCCWREGYYYNEPIVVILKDQEGINGDILVAQTWHDIYLASPGDLVVPGTLRTEFDEFFIETWNIYTLKKQNLGPCLGKITGDVVEKTLKMQEDPNFLPDWAPRLIPLVEDDPRLYFQRLEIETGHTFSIRNTNFFSFAGNSVGILIAKLKKIVGAIEWYWSPETIEECLALLRFAPETSTLSASADDRKVIIASCFTLRDGEIKTVQPVECTILHEKFSPEEYTITGDIPGLLSGMDKQFFMCFLSDEKNRSLTPGEWSWDDGTKHFSARFDRMKIKDGRVSIIIVDTISQRDPP